MEDQQIGSDLYKEDGVTHIRIDNRARTTLGRMLDPQYFSSSSHPELGTFSSAEGFFFYISLQQPIELLKVYNGCECRRFLKDLKKSNKFNKIDIPNFYDHIRYANYLKIKQNQEGLKDLFIDSTLPFRMYYVKKHKNKDEIYTTGSTHPRLRNFTELRESFQEDPEFTLEMPDVSIIKTIHDQNR